MARFEQPLGIVLAGGEGKRLMPLTADRAKPAVPFGGSYRLVDFVLSNLVNAEMRKIAVLTQYKSHSLDRHITTTWRMSTLLGNYVTPVPAQQRLGPRWYTGSADAILRISAFTKFESTKSTRRYEPPNGTAGLARSAVNGIKRLPSPPAKTIPSGCSKRAMR